MRRPLTSEARLALAAQLRQACADPICSTSLQTAEDLLKAGAEAWFPDADTGWTALHAAAARNDLQLTQLLLKNGALWELLDVTGATAADVAYSLNHVSVYQHLLNEGIRAQLLRTALEAQLNGNDSEEMDEDQDSAAVNVKVYLKSKLVFKGHGAQQVCVDEEGNGVMMGWETNIMQKTAQLLCQGHPNADALNVVNIGHGLGIIDEALQAFKPRRHVSALQGILCKLKPTLTGYCRTVIEAHPDVLAHMRETGWYDRPGVEIYPGRWQDWLVSQPDTGVGLFDVVYWDTFSEHYRDLYAFFDQLPNIMDEHARTSFFHGLGATSRTFYDIYTSVSELHLQDVGLKTTWHSVPIADGGEVMWDGVVRRYWDLSEYRLPIATFDV